MRQRQEIQQSVVVDRLTDLRGNEVPLWSVEVGQSVLIDKRPYLVRETDYREKQGQGRPAIQVLRVVDGRGRRGAWPPQYIAMRRAPVEASRLAALMEDPRAEVEERCRQEYTSPIAEEAQVTVNGYVRYHEGGWEPLAGTQYNRARAKASEQQGGCGRHAGLTIIDEFN